MSRLPSTIALPLAAAALLAVSFAIAPTPQAAAQVPTPKPVVPAAPPPAVKPAGTTTTAPRAGGIPLDLAGGMVAGGSAVAGAGLYALRRRKRPA